MDLHLAGQAAIVVGGARGIGLAIAREFAAEGALVGLLDRDEQTAAAARSLGEEYGIRTLGLCADATQYAAMQDAAQSFATQLGRLDHIVFAVGIGSGKFGFPFWNLKPEDWPRVMEINVQSAVNVLHAFTPTLVKAQCRHLIADCVSRRADRIANRSAV